jgi:hypothetical protein
MVFKRLMNVFKGLKHWLLKDMRATYDKSVRENIDRLADHADSLGEVEFPFYMLCTPLLSKSALPGLCVFCERGVAFMLKGTLTRSITSLKKVHVANYEDIQLSFAKYAGSSLEAPDDIRPSGKCPVKAALADGGTMPGDTVIWFFGAEQRSELARLAEKHGLDLFIPDPPGVV